MESSDLAHLPGRGVQISRLAREASLYRPGAAPGGKEEAARGEEGGGSQAAGSAAPPAGPGKRGVLCRSWPHLRQRWDRGAHVAGTQGAVALPAEEFGPVSHTAPPHPNPALGHSPRL